MGMAGKMIKFKHAFNWVLACNTDFEKETIE